MGRLQIKKFAEVDLLEDSWYGGYYFDFFIITGKLTMALSIGLVEVIQSCYFTMYMSVFGKMYQMKKPMEPTKNLYELEARLDELSLAKGLVLVSGQSGNERLMGMPNIENEYHLDMSF